MQRSELASTVLQLKALGVDNMMAFDWLAPPPAETMVRALELLHALGALGADARSATSPSVAREVTRTGQAFFAVSMCDDHWQLSCSAATGCAALCSSCDALPTCQGSASTSYGAGSALH